MPTFSDLTYFDLVIAFIFLFFLLRGLWIGFMRQLAAFFALVGSYYLAGQYASQFLPFTERFVDNPKLTFLVSFAIIFLISAIAFALIGRVLHRIMQVTLLGWLDRISGVFLGGVKAAVVASLLYMFLASSLSATNELLRKAYFSPYLKQGAEVLQSLIDDPGLRKNFLQKEPAILTDFLHGKSEQKKSAQ
jgi:membrane protein required for colicin V production